MFTAAALVSCPPLLIPELAGAAAAETADLRGATRDAAAALAARAAEWTVVGVAAEPGEFASGTVGTFAGFGADVTVGLGAHEVGAAADPLIPLPVLVAGWLRGQTAERVVADAVMVTASVPPEQCMAAGRRLRARLDSDAVPRGVLVVGDGAATLTDKAPGAFDDRAPGVQRELDRALDVGDVAALAALDVTVCAELGIEGRAAWQVLAGLFGERPAHCETLYRGAPYGVAYHVGTWWP